MTAQTILPANSAVDSGFSIDNSLRFNAADDAHLDLTDPPGNNYYGTMTFTFWVKRHKLGAEQFMFQSSAGNTTSFTGISFGANDALYVQLYDSTDNLALSMITNRQFLDVSAWYHIMVAFDLNNGTSGNRIKIYVNGVRETSFATATIPSAGFGSAAFINATDPIYIGRGRNTSGTTVYSDFSLAQYLCVTADSGDTDGLNGDAVLVPTAVGEFDDDSGIWKPIEIDPAVLGGDLDMSDNLGTNGFFLDFEASGNLGNDANGGTDFDENNIAATDQQTDSPTNNFTTMNPLDNFYAAGTFTEGNLQVASRNAGYSYNTATFGLSSGKWYWEVKWSAQTGSTNQVLIGIAKRIVPSTTVWLGSVAYTYAYQGSSGHVHVSDGNATNSTSTTYSVGDIISVAMDLDNNKIHFAKNGTYTNSSNPAGNSGGVAIAAANSELLDSGFYFPAFGDGNNNLIETGQFNFGGGCPHAISSAVSDGNGHGNFEFAVPSGYLAICTKNISATNS